MLSSKHWQNLISLSREFGGPDYAIGGGGNTSVKDADVLLVKKSGWDLKSAREETFVQLDRQMLRELMMLDVPDDATEREVTVKRHLLRSIREPDKGGRPSVEAILHHLIPYRFVVHTHPWTVNSFTCSKEGRRILKETFPDSLVVPYCDPGYVLALKLGAALTAHTKHSGSAPRLIFLENHGLIVAGDQPAEVRRDTKRVVTTCTSLLKKAKCLPDLRPAVVDDRLLSRVVVAVRSALSANGRKTATVVCTKLAERFAAGRESVRSISLPFTPDQIVYCGSHPLFVPVGQNKNESAILAGFERALASFRKRYRYEPRVVVVEGLGIIALGDTKRESDLVAAVTGDVMKVAFGANAAGGPRPLSARARAFIESWEVESYRRSVSTAGITGARTVIVTGGAQGFGEGIVRSLHGLGYNVVIADLNTEKGSRLAGELSGKATGGCIFVHTNVSDDASVQRLLTRTGMEFGGCDVFISNAGVLRAGGLEEMETTSFEFMTRVNYTGYFIGAKYASEMMKLQHRFAPHLFCDIIQINSKSGLEGSNRNFAYAGGKFGGIGLTQSFALELISSGIKVNAICPGNFLDGPLWADPETGLFVQYLKAGKVPGAKTVGDVRRAYEQKVPAGRGCTVSDVIRAITYVIEQEYETGQAVPVTGGQVMLK